MDEADGTWAQGVNATFWRYNMIIVAGKIFARSGTRESYLESTRRTYER